MSDYVIRSVLSSSGHVQWLSFEGFPQHTLLSELLKFVSLEFKQTENKRTKRILIAFKINFYVQLMLLFTIRINMGDFPHFQCWNKRENK